MPPLVPLKRFGHSVISQFIKGELGETVFFSALLFAILAILASLASAQCDYMPKNLTFKSIYSGGPTKCSYYNPNYGCAVDFSHNNLGGGPDSYCFSSDPPTCPNGAAIGCYTEGNTGCGAIVDTWANIEGAPSEHFTVTTLGIGGPSCNVSKSVPPGLGPAGTSTNPQGCCGDPVSTGSGNYYYQHTDLSIDDHIAGLPLVFQRSYNSLDTFNGTLGHNWTHNFDITVATTYDKSGYPNGAVVKWGDGHGEVFTLSGGVYVPAPGVTNALTRNSENQYTLTRKDSVGYLFSWDGLLENIQNPNGLFIYPRRDTNHNLTNLYFLNSGAQYLSFSYDQNNRISSLSDQSGRTVSYSYDTNGNLISETDPLGNVTTYVYDSGNRLTSIMLPNKSALVQNTYDSSSRVISQTNANGFTTAFSYNTPMEGQTTITDPLGNKTVHTYDSLMQITGIRDALDNTTSYTYDANNNVASVTDARGNTSNYTYDSLGDVLSYTDPLGDTASFTYNSFSEPLTIKTSKGNTTTLTYDGNGNLTTVKDPLGNQTTFSYDSYGLVTSATDARNNTTTFSWYTDVPICLTGITDAVGNLTSLTCDSIGRLTSITDPNQHTSSIAYDLLSRIVSLTDALSDDTLFAYDTVSNLTTITDANGHSTGYSYDPVGNLTQVTDALGHKTSYAYDQNINRIEFVNAKGKATKYTYSSVNRLTKVSDPLRDTTSYAYDPVGNVTSEIDANGKQSKFTYDKDNRLEKIAYADGSTVRYAYDPDSNRSTMVDAHGKTSYSYDALDRVLSVAFPGANTVTYAYDAVGNRISLKYPDGKSVTYTYDADNRVSQVTDWLSQITGYSFDPASNPTGIAYPNKVTSAFSYDAANRLTGIVTGSNGSAFRTLGYILDKVGNRTEVTDNSVATNYVYDALNELLSSQTGKGKTSWTYDAVGNRIKQTAPKGVGTDYTYDAADRMLTAGTSTFTYDKNGNRLTETTSSGTTTNSYDSENRLISSSGPNGTSSFSYDGDGNRITQTTPAGTYSYANDTVRGLPVVLNEKGPDGAIDYAYAVGLTESFSSAFNYFYNLDALGSVSNLTDSTGTVQETYSYDAWGNALTAKGNVGTQNKFRFTGQALDPATGLYFLRARYNDPNVGRFLTKDPLGGVATSPLTTHRYVYVGNNPTRYNDPSGLQEEDPSDDEDPLTEMLRNREENNQFANNHQTLLGRALEQWADFTENTQDFVERYGIKTPEGSPSSCSVTPPPNPTNPPLPPLPPLPPDLLSNPKYWLPPGPSIWGSRSVPQL